MKKQSVLTKKQKKEVRKDVFIYGNPVVLVLHLRYDDTCGNGHNTFAITMDTYEKYRHSHEPRKTHKNGTKTWLNACGCQHDEIKKYFPEYAKYIKWHLTSSGEPMYYIANSQYHAKNGNLEYAKSSAVWEDATLEDILNTDKLKERLPKLMEAFQKDMEKLGFVC